LVGAAPVRGSVEDSDDDDDGLVMPGLVLLRMATDKGALGIGF
jgi:hypothetical protein